VSITYLTGSQEDKSMNTIETMTEKQLFIIREALSLLAEKTQADRDNFGDFDTIAKLENDFTIAYYSMKGII
jgi:hypothetical protein